MKTLIAVSVAALLPLPSQAARHMAPRPLAPRLQPRVVAGAPVPVSGRHPAHRAPGAAVVQSLRITILSTMLAGDPGRGIGEWGFAALVEADGRRLLIDTGARPGTVLQNARELGLDLSDVEALVLTHNHGDHVGGLMTLRRELQARNPRALAIAHVAPGIFTSRPGPNGREGNGLLPLRSAYEASGGSFVSHDRPTELLPGVWFTGPVPRVHPERNYGGVAAPSAAPAAPAVATGAATASAAAEDNIPEDASVVIRTAEGLVVITGCGHAGIVNIVTHAQAMVPGEQIHAVVGGLHLFAASDAQLAWTGAALKARGVDFLLGVHCTGLEATAQLRTHLGLPRSAVATGAVGATFTLGRGIDPRQLAR
jgi:7,8-dihydropterin-6-yl-methyl-4-(beta-D-ribofuranosyl)aminobenzene 5'-phosphate synthase